MDGRPRLSRRRLQSRQGLRQHPSKTQRRRKQTAQRNHARLSPRRSRIAEASTRRSRKTPQKTQRPDHRFREQRHQNPEETHLHQSRTRRRARRFPQQPRSQSEQRHLRRHGQYHLAFHHRARQLQSRSHPPEIPDRTRQSRPQRKRPVAPTDIGPARRHRPQARLQDLRRLRDRNQNGQKRQDRHRL